MAAAMGMWEVAGTAVCVTTEGHNAMASAIMWLPSRAAFRKVRSGRQLGEYAKEAACGHRSESRQTHGCSGLLPFNTRGLFFI